MMKTDWNKRDNWRGWVDEVDDKRRDAEQKHHNDLDTRKP